MNVSDLNRQHMAFFAARGGYRPLTASAARHQGAPQMSRDTNTAKAARQEGFRAGISAVTALGVGEFIAARDEGFTAGIAEAIGRPPQGSKSQSGTKADGTMLSSMERELARAGLKPART